MVDYYRNLNKFKNYLKSVFIIFFTFSTFSEVKAEVSKNIKL